MLSAIALCSELGDAQIVAILPGRRPAENSTSSKPDVACIEFI